MSDPAVDLELALAHGLSQGEWEQILALLGRTPTYPELGIFSVMWSEHCSYKSSKRHLATLPTEGPQVIEGPGENAGVVAIGDGLCAVFKIESHNHPSFIEPHAGAATGVGGILRDVFTMGARPLASLNSLRFGPLAEPRQRYLVRGVVAGIADYGNCFGCATVGGEVTFHPRYRGNILVNAMNLGIAREDEIFRARATGVGNPVIYVGSKTGRDGIHGATMASAEFDDETEEKRPTVQVGDPFTEKLLLEACLEAMATGLIVGIQDMGAAGLTCSAFEMASSAGTGIEMHLERVPQREEGLTPYELLLSESQERMLFVAQKGREADLAAIFEKWDLDFAVVGEVTDDGFMRIFWKGEPVVAIPVDPIAKSSPSLDRPQRPPADLAERRKLDLAAIAPPADLDKALLDLLASPNLCSRRWVYRQYDQLVQSSTVLLPGGDAAVLRVPGTRRGLAVSTDCNPRYCAIDPFAGAAHAVAEAARNVAVTGARPLAITNCLNFGSPEKPEGMWELAEAIRGMGEACRALGTPVVSGNVSLYNETEGAGAIPPTPTIGMVGLLEDIAHAVPAAFAGPGDAIFLLGDALPELGASEALAVLHGIERGAPPVLDLGDEKRLQDLLVAAAARRLLRSAHDLAEGGLAIALAECAMRGGAGGAGPVRASTPARAAAGSEGSAPSVAGDRVATSAGAGVGLCVDLPNARDLRLDVALFGESGARAIVSVAPEHESALQALAEEIGVPAVRIGGTGGDRLVIRPGIDVALADAREAWERTLPEVLDHA